MLLELILWQNVPGYSRLFKPVAKNTDKNEIRRNQYVLLQISCSREVKHWETLTGEDYDNINVLG
jgi:hypothetical protein